MTLYLVVLGGLLISATTAFGLSILVRDWALQNQWVDEPDGERKAHPRAIPCIGGLAIAGGVTAGLGCFAALQELLPFGAPFPLAVWLGSMALLGTGLYDDIRGLGFKGKFVVQVAVAYLMLWAGFRIDLSFLSFVEEYRQHLFSIPLTMLWIVGVINAVNLIDGMDGLAAGVVVIAFASLAAVFSIHGDLRLIVLALAVIGASAGFLLHNFNPATIFMGDSGSMVLGFWLAIYAVQGTGHSDRLLALLIPVIAVGLPVLDTLLSIIRRFLVGKSPFMPDDDHIHHRLLRFFGSHRSVVLILYAVSLCFGAGAVVLALTAAETGTVILGLLLIATYVFLRKLGYLRVRATLRTMQARVEAYRLEQGQTRAGGSLDDTQPRPVQEEYREAVEA